MSKDPTIFDEAWAEAQGHTVDVVDVPSVDARINTGFTDTELGIVNTHEAFLKEPAHGNELDYEASVGVKTVGFDNPDHELHRQETIMLALGQDVEHPAFSSDDFESYHYSESWAYLTPDLARKVAQHLLDHADRIDGGTDE